jgi:hypothetical protein
MRRDYMFSVSYRESLLIVLNARDFFLYFCGP